MKKWINKKRIKMTKLTMQLWKEIAIVINWKYLKKKFQWNEKNKKKINKNKMENMQMDHELHVTRMIYACKIWELNRVVTSIWKKYQQISEDWHWFLEFKIKKKNEKKMVKQDNKWK